MTTDLSVMLNADQIAALSTPDLMQYFAANLKITSDRLVHLALIWNDLNKRGVDLSGIRGGLFDYIPLIATNKLDASLVMEFAGNKTLLSSLTRVPLEQQKKIAETKKVDFVTIDENKKKTVKELDLRSARAQELYQVFGGDQGIRDADQQYLLLANRQDTSPPKPRKQTLRKVQVTDDKEYLEFGKSQVRLDSVIEALGNAYGMDLHAILKKK